jgi:hypothetical protein
MKISNTLWVYGKGKRTVKRKEKRVWQKEIESEE